MLLQTSSLPEPPLPVALDASSGASLFERLAGSSRSNGDDPFTAHVFTCLFSIAFVEMMDEGITMDAALGLDRDSGLVAAQFDERDEAVKVLLHRAIAACKKAGKYIGICGQGPSDHPDFAEWLVKEGIDSLSLNPDSVWDTCLFLSK